MTTADIFHPNLFEMNPLCNDLIFKSGDIKRDSIVPSWSLIDSEFLMSDFGGSLMVSCKLRGWKILTMLLLK